MTFPRFTVGLILLVTLAAGRTATADPVKIAFYPLTPGDSALSREATGYLKQILGRDYRIVPPEVFQPVLEKEKAKLPDYPVESFYQALTPKLGIGHVITGEVEKTEGNAPTVSYTVSVLDLATSRSRVFSLTSPEKKHLDALHKMGHEMLGYLKQRSRLNPPSDRNSDLVKKLVSRLPKGPRPPVAIAIDEQINSERSERLFTEETLDYYLTNAGFPVKYGEGLLLREYSRFFFAGKRRDFPRTLTSRFYVIGEATAEQAEKDENGLDGAKTKVKMRLLDKHGDVILARDLSVQAFGLSPESAAANALQTAASEIAFDIFPLLKY